ncbi:hypothetical protein [Neoroseomonas lacus]|uniref:Uncharacterized protein n=1 Tax=Neoroseomonas lacus TaxID=287609 RepID=A0A917NYB6_9PROT|nr:hypothetical protein [Neoroseomonas lacus]GGJ36758.1 hypothetical protein GCM10011320_50590 [Neoroseomonas lacus]
MSAARYRDVYISGPDLVAPVLRGHAPAIEGAPYRISPFFPPTDPTDVFAEVVERIRGGLLQGRQTAAACWCALVGPREIAELLNDLYGAPGQDPPPVQALRRFVAVLPHDCTFALVAATI